jgi:hypothetical protein
MENPDAAVRPPFLVFVRDRNGWPIQGAKINFAVNGQDGFEVSNTEGRGSIMGIGRSDQLLVRATYEGQTEEARPAPDTDQYTFRFDVDVAPIGEVASRQRIPGWFPIAGVAFAVATFVSLFYLLIGPELAPSRKIIFDAWLAFCVASSASFLGGSAVARGLLKIPFMKDAPVNFLAFGGVGVFLVVLIILVGLNH